jgi:SAM-dependent methyltransferase
LAPLPPERHTIDRPSASDLSFETGWQRRFEDFAESHEEEHLVSGWSDVGLRRRLRIFGRILEYESFDPPGRTLDLGCGAGTYVRALARLGHRAVGLDYSAPTLDRACRLDAARAGQYVGGYAYALPFKSGTFDLVSSIGVLQALSRPADAFREIVRVARPGGLIVFEFLNAFAAPSLIVDGVRRLRRLSAPVRRYSPYEILRLLKRAGVARPRFAPVYLPPRGFPRLDALMHDCDFIENPQRLGPLTLAFAHAFICWARRS